MTNTQDSYFNTDHLDHLSEEVVRDGTRYRIIHIYCKAPDYTIVPDPEEGTACVDDAARAAVVYLRHFEITGDKISRTKAEALLRFVMYMQTTEGLFYNFVTNANLDINITHIRSRADQFEWWSARAVWALGTAVRVLKNVNPDFTTTCLGSLRLALPHVEQILSNYPNTTEYIGRTVPTWLVQGDGADATSELMLGLVAWNQAEPNLQLQTMIMQFAEGLALMRYGSMNTFPYGLHASNRNEWHKWGNSQTQALAEAGIVTSAKLEAEHFYPRLLVEGLLKSIVFDDLHAMQYFERIAYGLRSVAVGLIRLYKATKDIRFARMAGLFASWLTGNNNAGQPMYDPDTGRCYDGLLHGNEINRNSGAESTIEALYTILEIEQYPEARRWFFARGLEHARTTRDDCEYLYRIFVANTEGTPQRIAVIMNLSLEKLDVLEGKALDDWLVYEAPRGD